MSIEQLGYARPDLRNPSLAVMTEVLTSTENRYSGIPTMRRTMKEFGLPAPKFENRRDEFVVTLYNTPEEAEMKKPAEPGRDLLGCCQTPRTRQEIAAYLGIRTVSYAMDKFVKPLLKEGRLKMTLPQKPQSRKQKYYTVR
jgi:ATP-dependent DNA helicase RecG